MGNIFIDDTKFVKDQYKNSNGLSTRISIHDKYSTNKMGLHNWYFTVMKLEEGMRVLELGTGSAVMWVKNRDVIGKLSQLVLSDMSEGMLAEAKKNLGEIPNIEYEVIDIQDIPFEDNTFDAVIANCMLYHVPDINKAVSEVRRVLKSDGCFYAGTSGQNGVLETIADILEQDISYENNFSLENGGEKLEPFFTNVRIERYKDSLEITNIDDLMDYIYSGITFEKSCTLSREEVREKLLSNMADGVLKLPKDPGMFVAW
ncbi:MULTISPECIES: class I SAM-dependent methyltransferase [unclassified Butyrivibrio]|uniref:class I SAM-dependent methyltransferase n=1 Tax=unclassified Butyrivibrio TaxID=2639466 RepID=UPI0003B3D2E7|nr:MULTISPECIES: class I SAM-dependent methyltransferase [unclassified Butyrivibrio]